MSIELLAMDHWLVCPTELYGRLKEEFVPLVDSRLLDLRLNCGAVECVPKLEDLRMQVQAALQHDAQAVRIVLPQLGRVEYEALGSFEPAQAARLHLYDFGAQPEDVLGSLCTPEDAIAAAMQPMGVDPPARMIVVSGVDEAVGQSYADAVRQWQQSVAAGTKLEQEDDEPSVRKKALEWLINLRHVGAAINSSSTASKLLLAPAQWSEVFQEFSRYIAPSRFTTAEPVRGAIRRSIPAKNLTSPHVEFRPTKLDLEFELRWQPGMPPGMPSTEPEVVVKVDGQPVALDRAEWSQDCRLLVLAGVELPHQFRYGWSWQGEINLLTLFLCTKD